MRPQQLLRRLKPLRTWRALVHTARADRAALRDLPAWFASRFTDGGPLEAGIPWMSFSAVRWLSDHLPARARLFEFGSGGSTLYWASRTASLVSIEHDATWYGLVRQRLDECRAAHCDYRLVPPVDGGDCRYAAYVATIDTEPDASFDAVIVDGRARCACVDRAIAKVRRGGYLVLDNSDRPWYERALTRLAAFERHDFRGIAPGTARLSRTTIWRLDAR